jgi:chromosome segregation ATPase
MPTGFPNDPIAYAAKQALASQRRAAAKAEKFGSPAKRVEAADAESVQTTVVVEEPVKRVHKKRAYTPRKSARPSIVKEDLEAKFNASQKTVVDLESDLERLQERYDTLLTKSSDLQDSNNDREHYIFTLLEVLSKQQNEIEDLKKGIAK